MAEVAALPSISSVVCCGVKLSLSVYEFAVYLGSASRELKNLASIISHFCSVLKQVQSVLREATSFKVSPNAIQTTQNILDKSQELFNEISAILRKLRKDDRSQVGLLKRVQWMFKKPRVLLLQESLRSCDAMLHLMLTTMSFARLLAATKRYSKLESNAEDEEQRALIHTLFLAQKGSNERLEELEDECFLEDGLDTSFQHTQTASPLPFSPLTSPEEAKRSPDQGLTDCARSSRFFHSHGKNDTRFSTLLNALLYQQEEFGECQRFAWTDLTDHRQSVIESDSLLQTWTDQRDPLAWEQACNGPEDEEVREKSRFAGDNHPYKTFRKDFTAPDTVDHTGDDALTSDAIVSPDLPEVANLTLTLSGSCADNSHPYQTSNPVIEPRVRGLLPVGLEESSWIVPPAMLWKYNNMEDWRDYSLYIEYVDGERLIQPEEKPLLLYGELSKADKTPTFVLRRKSGGSVDECAEASVVQPGSDKGLPGVFSGWAPSTGEDLPKVAPKSDEGLPEVLEEQPRTNHQLPEPIQPDARLSNARSTDALERSNQKLAKLMGLTYPFADAPEPVEMLPEIDEPKQEAGYLTESEIFPRPALINVRSSEAIERSQKKLAKLTGLSYIPHGGDALVRRTRVNTAGSSPLVNRSAITSPTQYLDTFDTHGDLDTWVPPPSDAQHPRSGSRPLPGLPLVRNMTQAPWESRSPIDDTVKKEVIMNRMLDYGMNW